MAADTPHPGWYPDPEDASRARYWDGERWTDRTGEREAIEASQSRPEGPPGPPGPAGQARPWYRRPLIPAAAVAALIAGVVAFVLLSSDQAGAEVILQPTSSAGVDPFTESVASESVSELVGNEGQGELAGGGVEQLEGSGGGIESLSGATPGLYGGTGEEAICDPAALAGFLEQNPEKAAAFAGALGIEAGQVADYIGSLTPLLLREDTRVTNHGFEGGVATPFEAILQTGSAVMVDERGVPRVRCACGNPLAEPAGTDGSSEYSGERWQGFDESRLLAVAPADQELDSFEVVDVETGETFEKAAGGTRLTKKRLLNLRMPPVSLQGATGPPAFGAARWEDGVHPESPKDQTGEGGVTLGTTQATVIGANPELNVDQRPQAAVGDLTGDGLDDGVVARVLFSCGASCIETIDLVAFDSSGQVLERIMLDGSPWAGDVETVEGLEIVNGGFELTAMEFGAGDAQVDGASVEIPLRFEWNGTEFEEVS